MARRLDICVVLFTLLCASLLVTGQPRPRRDHQDRPEQQGSQPTERNLSAEKYLVVLPKVLISGSSEVVCITLYEMAGPMNIQLTLRVNDDVVGSFDYFMEFSYACIELSIPEIETLSEEASLTVIGRYEGVRGELRDTKPVMIERPKLETFIETDKPIYKPGQTVKFRILTLDQNLRTDTSQVDKIWVETPSGVRIAQWLSVDGEQGLIGLELPMTPDPMLGKWKILVEHHDIKSESSFEVDEYVLPKFEVTIDGPSYLLVNETSIQYTICGRYTYGQPVIGAVRAELIPVFSYSRNELEPIPFMMEGTGPTGCAEANFDLSNWTLTSNDYTLYGAKFRLSADFTEIVTGVEIHEQDEGCKLTNEIFKVEFVGSKKFKKGLPFSGKVKVTTPDGAPAADITVHIVMTRGGQYERDVNTDSSGLATFYIDSVTEKYVGLEATIPVITMPHNSRYFQIRAGIGTVNLKSYYSPSDTFLKVSPVEGRLMIDSQVTLQVSHTGRRSLNSRDFRAIFMSKGHLVRPTISFSDNRPVSVGEGPGYNRLELTFTVTREMLPVTKLLVYFVQNDEVVADSVVFNTEQSLENQVEISFTSDEERPGEETWIDITAAPDSICGVGVVDKSVYLLGGGQNNIQESRLWEYLMGIQLGADSGVSFNPKCRPSGGAQGRPGPWSMPMRYQRRPSDADSSAAFNDAGLLYMTNLDLETAPCPEYPVYYSRPFHNPGPWGGRVMFLNELDGPAGPVPVPMAMIPQVVDDEVLEESTEPERQEPPRLRSYFPETWLWDLVPVNSNGRGYVNMTVPDTVTEWVGSGFCISETEGIGISSTSRLQAFQPFFVSYTLPYSVIRGETFPAKVTVFNYMSDCLVVELTLSESENFTMEENEDLVKSICVCGSQSASVEFNIIPSMLGMMPIKVTAESISDADHLCGNDFVASLTEAGDSIQKDILVEAEGIEQEVTKSEFFCISEYAGFTWSVPVRPPADIVPDTAWAKVTFSGDVMGTTLSNLDKLVRVPFGCGEQNMLTFVPNVLAMQYLTATDQLTPEIAKPATDNMKLGYQREFNYRHGDGSFSAFGESDDSGSTWLTAYVVRSFYQASQFIDVDFEELERSIDWLKGLQKADGCFRSVGRLCHKDMLGGVNNDLTLSAYVVISLLEAGQDPQDESIIKGVQCLERGITETDDTYALAQIAYSLALANSSKINLAMDKFHHQGPIDDSHWVSNREASAGSTSFHAPSSADVEITSYGLLTYIEWMDPADLIASGLPISRWLVQQRNANGGFGSTQDTVVGLTALSRFAEYTSSGDMDISLTVEGSRSQSEWGMSHELRSTNEDRLVLHQLYMDDIPMEVNFKATGEGCALVQVSWFYNLYPEEPELPEFGLVVMIDDHPQYVDCTRFLVEVCASYTGVDGASNMAVIDFRLQSGYAPDEESLKTLKAAKPELKRYEMDGKSVLFYFDEITSKPLCVGFTMVQDIKVKDTKPSFATVYDYYKTNIKKTVTYSLQCSKKPELVLLPQLRVWGHLAARQVPGPDVDQVPFAGEVECPPKIGHCDLIAGEEFVCEDPHEDQCSDDYECPGERKCCHDGCAHTCVYPEFPVPQPADDSIPVDIPAECWLDSCPICEDEMPADWENKFCYSYYALAVKFKGNNRFKLLDNYRYGEEPLDLLVDSTMDESCECQLERSARYILLTNYVSLDVESRQLVINEASLIVPFKGKSIRQMDPLRCPID